MKRTIKNYDENIKVVKVEYLNRYGVIRAIVRIKDKYTTKDKYIVFWWESPVLKRRLEIPPEHIKGLYLRLQTAYAEKKRKELTEKNPDLAKKLDEVAEGKVFDYEYERYSSKLRVKVITEERIKEKRIIVNPVKHRELYDILNQLSTTANRKEELPKPKTQGTLKH